MSDTRVPARGGGAEAVEPAERAGEREILAAIRGLRFGSVEVVVHDGRIVRIERREKLLVESSAR